MRNFISIFLASLVLLSNMGLTFATHYCGGFAVENQLMLGHEKLSCGMTNMDVDCENLPPGADSIKAKSCCENHYQTIDTDDDFNISPLQNIPSPEFVVAFVYAFLADSFLSGHENLQVTQYSPPILEYDLPVMNQVFLL